MPRHRIYLSSFFATMAARGWVRRLIFPLSPSPTLASGVNRWWVNGQPVWTWRDGEPVPPQIAAHIAPPGRLIPVAEPWSWTAEPGGYVTITYDDRHTRVFERRAVNVGRTLPGVASPAITMPSGAERHHLRIRASEVKTLAGVTAEEADSMVGGVWTDLLRDACGYSKPRRRSATIIRGALTEYVCGQCAQEAGISGCGVIRADRHHDCARCGWPLESEFSPAGLAVFAARVAEQGPDTSQDARDLLELASPMEDLPDVVSLATLRCAWPVMHPEAKWAPSLPVVSVELERL